MATFLAKANDLVVSHCRCATDQALIMSPAQMDCPWCGCGWLFNCVTCRKAFTFARAIEVESSYADLARRDLSSWYEGKAVPEAAVAEWVEFMELALRGVVLGSEYVILDSHVIRTDVSYFRETGVYAQHDLAFLPQVRALRNPGAIDESVGSKEYWLSRRIE